MAAITVNGVSVSTTGAGGGSISWSHTVSAGTDRFLAVAGGNGDADLATPTMTCTMAGSSVGVISLYDKSHTAWTRTYGFGKVNPATGATTIQLQASATIDQMCGGSTEFNGVHQTIPTGTAVTSSGATGTALTTGSGFAAATTEDVIYGSVMSDSEAGITQGNTLLWERENIASDTSGGAEYTAGTGSSTSLTWTATTTNQNWAAGGIPIKTSTPSGASFFPQFNKPILQGVKRANTY